MHIIGRIMFMNSLDFCIFELYSMFLSLGHSQKCVSVRPMFPLKHYVAYPAPCIRCITSCTQCTKRTTPNIEATYTSIIVTFHHVFLIQCVHYTDRSRSVTDCEYTSFTYTRSIDHTSVLCAGRVSVSRQVSTNTCE